MDSHILARFSAFDSHIIARFDAFRKNVTDRFYNMMIVASIVSAMEYNPVVDQTIRLLVVVLWYTLLLSMVPVMLLLLFLICGVVTIFFSSTCFLLVILSPWLVPLGSVFLALLSMYVVFRIARTVVAKIYEFLQEPLSLQAHYIIHSTPACIPVVRLWRSCMRNGFVQTFVSCGSRTALYVPERSIVVLQHFANQPALCTNIIQGAINLILTPVALLVKLGILIICPFVAVWKKIRTTIIRVLSGLTTFVKLYVCANVKTIFWFIFMVFRSILANIIALFMIPQLMWLWFASKVVPEEVLAMGNGEVILEILRKIPVIRNIGVVQRSVEYGVRQANDTVERFVYVRDHVTGEVYCSIRAARDGIHYHLDSYVNLPREVLFLLVRDYLVNGPIDTARRWMQVCYLENHLPIVKMFYDSPSVQSKAQLNSVACILCHTLLVHLKSEDGRWRPFKIYSYFKKS